MPARHSNLGGIQKIVAGGARPGFILGGIHFFSGGNPAKTPGRHCEQSMHRPSGSRLRRSWSSQQMGYR